MAEKKRKKKKKIQNRLPAAIAGAFLFILVLGCVGNLLMPDRKISEKEMRVLAGKPKLSVDSLVSGRFMRDYEAYVSDQFAGRDLWVKVKTTADSLTGKKEENGVFRGKNGYLLEDIAVPDEENLAENLNAMKQFQERYPKVPMHVMLVPNAANVLQDHLPMFAVTADQSRYIKMVKNELGGQFDWIDAEKTLKEQRDKDIFYRTDHHWTTLGAYYAFQDAKAHLGIQQEKKMRMEAYAVSDTFNGTLAAKSGYQSNFKEPIYIYLPEGESAPHMVVNYVEEQKKTASLYDSSKLKERDQYAVFLGGNHALVDIRAARSEGERLLVFKDSYANCFLPFLAPYYREMVIVDPRYYSGDLDRLMEEKQIDRVLFLYNANTFFEDRMLSGVLAKDEME